MATQRERLKDLFAAALDLKPEDRAAFLDRECNGDTELRAELEALLAAHANAGSFLEHPILESPTADSLGTSATVIGPYHLLELIGEGGMGQVWLAEQKQPVRRRVAIKLIKAGMDTREVVARFESERQALALMDHPAIAKAFKAGSTPEGRPYFVMEYVAGIPITDYCDRHRLTIRQRMELFVQVCEGVQHAHQKAIIHRDLKPSNILVTEIDGKPMPRIIDFGVAKATSQKLTALTVYTRVGMLIGTLGYMSPEQADPIGEDIDTRTDIYSLGAVLYELLAGAPPFDFEKLAYDEVLRVLRDQDAPRPSTKLTTLGDEPSVAAKNRGSDPPTLARELRGDPDAIALKALEKDRNRRYASASGLAADIGRYLNNEPVVAHPPSTAYRAGKYMRRHRLGVSVAAAVALLLLGVAIAQSLEIRRIRQERDRATRERDRADRITQFMTGMFIVSRPSEARGNTVTAREILDRASNQIETGLKDDPELQAKMMYTMADTYRGLGIYSRAHLLLGRAVGIQSRAFGSQNPDTLRSMSSLASILMRQGHYSEAENLARKTADLQHRILGPDDPDTLESMNTLALSLRGERHAAEAKKLASETLYARRRLLGPDHPATLRSMNTLASVLVLEGRYAEADRLQRETLDIQRRVLGPEHPNTLLTMYNLNLTLLDEDHFAEAEKLQRETIEIERRILGPEHPDTLNAMSNLVLTLIEEGRYPEAEKLARETLDIQRRVLGPENSDTVLTLEYEAADLSHEGRYGEAQELFRELIKTAEKKKPGLLPDAWYNFACAAAIAGHRGEALRYLGQAIDGGYWTETATIVADPDLKSLHGDPRFDALIAKARQKANSQPH